MELRDPVLLRTRRHFFRDCALGLGALGLTDLFRDGSALAAEPSAGFAALRARAEPASGLTSTSLRERLWQSGSVVRLAIASDRKGESTFRKNPMR